MTAIYLNIRRNIAPSLTPAQAWVLAARIHAGR